LGGSHNVLRCNSIAHLHVETINYEKGRAQGSPSIPCYAYPPILPTSDIVRATNVVCYAYMPIAEIFYDKVRPIPSLFWAFFSFHYFFHFQERFRCEAGASRHVTTVTEGSYPQIVLPTNRQTPF